MIRLSLIYFTQIIFTNIDRNAFFNGNPNDNIGL